MNGSIRLAEGLFLHHYDFTLITEPGTGLEARLTDPDGMVLASVRQIPAPEAEFHRIQVQAFSTHDVVLPQARRFKVWPAYPHRDLMDMARHLFPGYFRQVDDDWDDDE